MESESTDFFQKRWSLIERPQGHPKFRDGDANAAQLEEQNSDRN